jgi:hypothetical protein
MATDPTVPATPAQAAQTTNNPREIRVYSHSGLYYWWPVWFFGILFAIWTLFEDNRMVIVPKESILTKSAAEKQVVVRVPVAGETPEEFNKNVEELRLWKESEPFNNEARPKLRVSGKVWMGPLFLVILFLVILITNIPLRGLWSLVAVISIALLALVFTVFDLWEGILAAFGNLHVHMNMGGYLFLGVAVLVAWVLAVFFFDRRSYMIFTPGQMRVCEEIGGREKVYDTFGMTLEKHRADWFRHIVLGFGSGDLTVKTSGADRHEISMPNVAFIGFKIDAIQAMVRSREVH